MGESLKLDKGKPPERVGRKANRPKSFSKGKVVGLPGWSRSPKYLIMHGIMVMNRKGGPDMLFHKLPCKNLQSFSQFQLISRKLDKHFRQYSIQRKEKKMKNKSLSYFVLIGLAALLIFQTPRQSHAADDFEVSYQLMKFFNDKHMTDGMIFLSVTNWTEEMARNVELSIVTPFGFRIGTGTVQFKPIKPEKTVRQKANFIFSKIPGDPADGLEDGILFKLTYTDSLGEKREITISGEHK